VTTRDAAAAGKSLFHLKKAFQIATFSLKFKKETNDREWERNK
jgi:hypothetical protein